MALLHLVRASGRRVSAVTIDHGCRDVRDEIAICAAQCTRLDVPHQVVPWKWDGQGNFQAEARAARRALIGDWAAEHGLDHVMLAHTADDQAETVLLRIARGSGIDGLAGMDRKSGLWLRPLLGVARAALRAALREIGVPWAEDPSNQDPAYDRVRARQMADQLSDLGLTRARLLQLAEHAAAARRTLWRSAAQAAQHMARPGGDLFLSRDLLDARQDTSRRLAAAAIQWIGGHEYRPRWQALSLALTKAQSGKATLGGCLLRPFEAGILIGREPGAVAGRVPAGQVWDGRWIIDGPDDTEIGAIGADGLVQCPNWRESGLSRDTLLAAPALWRGNKLIAAPVLGAGTADSRLMTSFTQFLLSH